MSNKRPFTLNLPIRAFYKLTVSYLNQLGHSITASLFVMERSSETPKLPSGYTSERPFKFFFEFFCLKTFFLLPFWSRRFIFRIWSWVCDVMAPGLWLKNGLLLQERFGVMKPLHQNAIYYYSAIINYRAYYRLQNNRSKTFKPYL